jgi:hypothetical protein
MGYLHADRTQTRLPWALPRSLIYRLADPARRVAGLDTETLDSLLPEYESHFLEVANVRMLFIESEKQKLISEMIWCTEKTGCIFSSSIDACVTFLGENMRHRLAVINHPTNLEYLCATVENAIKGKNIDAILVISRNAAHLKDIKSALNPPNLSKFCILTTHEEACREGIAKAIFVGATMESQSFLRWLRATTSSAMVK